MCPCRPQQCASCRQPRPPPDQGTQGRDRVGSCCLQTRGVSSTAGDTGSGLAWSRRAGRRSLQSSPGSACAAIRQWHPLHGGTSQTHWQQGRGQGSEGFPVRNGRVGVTEPVGCLIWAPGHLAWPVLQRSVYSSVCICMNTPANANLYFKKLGLWGNSGAGVNVVLCFMGALMTFALDLITPLCPTYRETSMEVVDPSTGDGVFPAFYHQVPEVGYESQACCA